VLRTRVSVRVRHSRVQYASGPAAVKLGPTALDDLEELEWERPTRLPCQANASVSAEQIEAHEPRP
jgi:hypothetical protein